MLGWNATMIVPAEMLKMIKQLRSIEKEISIKAPWGKIAALSWGSPSNRPVLLCHGRQDACSSFRPLVAMLPKHYYYVSIDLPGNGRSDHLPRGVRYTIVDFVPTLKYVVDHFKWRNIIYIGHSMGVPIGKMFNIAYPGVISRTVELDPVPAHVSWSATPEGLNAWYHRFYDYYEQTRYEKYNGSPETAPKYTYEQIQELTMAGRGISKEASELVLERCLEPAGDGLYRLTFDQRIKEVTLFPFSHETLKQIYTLTKTPTFCVLASRMLKLGLYDKVKFLQDPSAWPHIDYKYKIVTGGHDFHLDRPDLVADDIIKFMNEDVKAKL